MKLHFHPGLDETQAEMLVDRQATYLNGFGDDDQNILIPKTENGGFETKIEGNIQSGIVANVKVFGVPRYPTQLIESLAYLIIFFILYFMYQKAAWKKEGLLFGSFLVLVFGFRFAVEYLKVVQVAAEEGMDFNLGQSLSIPLVLAGIFFIVRSLRQPSQS
jgi:prolipoprotein diacylglyceryltransferase